MLAEMMISGANNLYNNKKIVNDLNVFPVPDGDTGTNMSMTVTAMAKTLEEIVVVSASKVADTMAYATLRGARGNSGVILSQFFRGISKSIKGKNTINAKDFAMALKEGADAAYKAVMNPTEGTILTVAKEIALAAVKESENNENINLVVEVALKRGKKVLSKTQDMLPALKKAGVVDAGGQGWVFFLDGVFFYLKNGEQIKKNVSEEVLKKAETNNVQKSIDNENIKYGYCTEFIIEKKNKSVDVLSFRSSIETKGDSMLVIDDDDIVKVHIHTNNPGYILERAIKLGSMINIKIDNMKYQHQNLIENESVVPEENFSEKDTAFVAVAAGKGLSDIVKSIGIGFVIEGGQTMNPSTEDILEAIKKLNAKHVFVFPNNKNIILAAEQARELAECEVIVMQSKNIPQCISAMIAYNANKPYNENVKIMEKAMLAVDVGQVTYAVRDTEMDEKIIKTGDVLGLVSGKIEETGNDVNDICCKIIEKIVSDDTEFVNVYYGEDIKQEQAEKLGEIIEDRYPEIEVSIKNGGQPLYYYIVSAE